MVGSCDAGQAMPAGHGVQVVDMATLWYPWGHNSGEAVTLAHR